MQCNCGNRDNLVAIGNDYSGFVANLRCLETGDWVKLMQCLACDQLWRTDEWDKYEPLYALKLDAPTGWEEVDMAPLIKERMVQNHGGLDSVICIAKDCKLHALRGRAYCVDHFYENGARA